jgi:hypothetical protein
MRETDENYSLELASPVLVAFMKIVRKLNTASIDRIPAIRHENENSIILVDAP